MEAYDICIVGGGASGMCAAITAKEINPNKKILIIEKKEEMGKKIIASGNGKCNMTNINCVHSNEILDFFHKLGVITRTDAQGRVYPYTEESRAVTRALIGKIESLGIETIINDSVLEITQDNSFIIKTNNKTISCEKLLLACGGKAGSGFGTTGDGYKWARELGHSIKKPIPVLTAIDLKEDVKDLAGIRAKGKVRLLYKAVEIFEEVGEIQFTKTGLSGICVFNMSRYLLLPEGKSIKNGFDDYDIEVDFFPERTDLEKELKERGQLLKMTGINFLNSMVKEPIGKRMLKECGNDYSLMARTLHNFKFKPDRVKGWDFAQATKGGVDLKEINYKTMESKLVKNLFFAGEIIDFDGPCGGYNLQNAWETGIKAGMEMANV